MPDKPITVVETPVFIRSAEMAGIEQAERQLLVDFLARQAMSGAVIVGTGGVRKIRWAPEGVGKSGAYRVIYFYYDPDAPLYALLVYGKGSQADLTPQQRKAVSGLAEDIKRSVRAKRDAKGRR